MGENFDVKKWNGVHHQFWGDLETKSKNKIKNKKIQKDFITLLLDVWSAGLAILAALELDRNAQTLSTP